MKKEATNKDERIMGTQGESRPDEKDKGGYFTIIRSDGKPVKVYVPTKEEDE